MQFYLLYMFGGPNPDRSLDARGTNVPGTKGTHPPSDDRDAGKSAQSMLEPQKTLVCQLGMARNSLGGPPLQ